MALPRDRRPAARLGWTGLVLVVALAAGARDTSRGSGGGSSRQPGEMPPWLAGRAVAIAVDRGRARFTMPTPNPGSRTLLVVSTLARGPGPFRVEAGARPVDPSEVRPPATEAPPEAHAPSLPEPTLPPVPAPAPASRTPPASRSFHLMVRDGDVISPSNYIAVKAALRAVGTRVQVYVDERDDASVAQSAVHDVVATFDDRVFPLAADTIGQARDVDGDGRFTVLLSGWLTRLGGGRHAVDGFVRGADLDATLPAPFSNHCDMMYLNAALPAGPHLRTVIAHEYTHAVSFSARAHPAGPEEEGWLDEAIAHLVEDRHGFSRSNLDYRVSAFLSEPERYRLVVEDYYAADLFRSHGNRGGTYLFLRWCADRFGPALVPALIHSGRQGVANIEAATGTAFADLYRSWSLALFTTGLDPSHPDRDGFRSVDVRGASDGWLLAGPRTTPVVPGGSAARWSSAGTASRFLVVEPSATGAVEVDVSAAPQALLQVTAMPLPDDLGSLDVSAETLAGPGETPGLRVRVAERNGTAVRLSGLSWEPLVPGPDPHAEVFRHDGLDARGLADAFGTADLRPRGRLTSTVIPSGLDDPHAPGPVVVKVVGTDALGRRVAGWAEFGSRRNVSSRR